MGINTTHFIYGIRDFVAGRRFSELLVKGFRLWQREGLHGLRQLVHGLAQIRYSEWISLYDTLTEHDRLGMSRHIEAMKYRPLISVLMPTYNTPEWLLQKAIASVQNQLYANWELCIADDASDAPHVREFLEHAAREDPRIRIVLRPDNGHISAATNSALELARGDFIALLDHDDELAESALYHVASALNDQPSLDLLYSDEDKIDARGRRFGHYFKPDWNPDLFCSQNMISHLGVYRTSIARVIGGFRTGYEGSQDWDFALRFVEKTDAARIHHIPRVLYHWRTVPGSTAVSISAKNYAIDAAHRSLADFWKKRNLGVVLEGVEPGHFNAHVNLPATVPLVSIIIIVGDRLDYLFHCLEGLDNRTDYPKREILLVTTELTSPEIRSHLASRHETRNLRILEYAAPPLYSTVYNWAVTQACGELICLLSEAARPACASWLKDLVGHALRPEIGATGGKLCSPDRKIMHAGFVLYDGKPECPFVNKAAEAAGYANRARLNQNVSAVSAACLVVRKSLWERVAGIDDENFPAYPGDVDLCLRLIKEGYRNLWVPQALLIYAGEMPFMQCSDDAGRSIAMQRLRSRWGGVVNHDPAWNPNLAINDGFVRLATPPRLSLGQDMTCD